MSSHIRVLIDNESTIPLPTGAATEAKQTQPGVDIGDVTVNNAAGASAVNVQDGGNSITVDGTIAATQSGTWNVNNVSGTVSLPTGAATETTLSAINVKLPTIGQQYARDSISIAVAKDQVDAFGRQRNSFPRTLFESKLNTDASPYYWDDSQTSGSGTSSTYNANQASVTLAVGASTAGTRVRQTFQRFPYQPGHSQLVLMTGILGASASGITRRIGTFDAKNGLFFESNGTDIRVVRRTYTSGSAVDNGIAQGSWNIDKMNGTGRSGITIDWSKTQIFSISYQWLGVGSVLFGLNVGGVFYPCHQIDNANSLSLVYMSHASLPCRYEITNSGAGGAASLLQICCSVMSEGGEADTGMQRSVTRDATGVLTTGASTSYYPLLAIRHQSGMDLTRVTIDSVGILATATASNKYVNFVWKLLLNPTVTGTALSFTALTNSCVEYDVSRTSATTVSAGLELNAGMGNNSAASNIVFSPNHIRMGTNIAGTSDILVLAIQSVGGTAETFSGTIMWQEQ